MQGSLNHLLVYSCILLGRTCIIKCIYLANIPAARVNPHKAGDVDLSSGSSILVRMNTVTKTIVSSISMSIP